MTLELNRFRLELEFDGTGYVGWQRQDNGPSIQGEIEKAVHAMLGEQVTAMAAGRTDAGVHALALTIHIDLARGIEALRLQSGLNHFLRDTGIAVIQTRSVTGDFHARFSAKTRHYKYRILNRLAHAAIDRNRVWQVSKPLVVDAMSEASLDLIGHHDFTSFRASECQAKSPIKTLQKLRIERDGDEIIIFASAQSFLHHQVRNIVGTLKLIGVGTRPVGFAKKALEACDRTAAGPTAPACGLYFIKANYDED